MEEGSAYDGAFEDAPAIVVEEEDPLDLQTIGLLHRGYMTDLLEVGGHEISLQTLTIGEELQAAMIADKYKETIEAGRALATALVAASITSVDGKPIVEALGPNDTDLIELKFKFIRDNWYWVTIKPVYDKYNEMLEQVYNIYLTVKKN